MKAVDAAEVVASGVKALGFDPDYVDFAVPEVLAAVVRWTAAQHCPTTATRLRKLVITHLGPIAEQDRATLSNNVDEIIELLVAASDLVESPHSGRTELLLGSPRFVRVADDDFVVLGCAPAGRRVLHESLQSAMNPDRHIRRINPAAIGSTGDDLADRLRSEGLVEIKATDWVRSPREHSWKDHLDRSEAFAAGGLDGSSLDLTTIKIFDPTAPPHYYSGRWRLPRPSDEGLLLGRRPQAWGSDLWFLGHFEAGLLATVNDLPNPDWSGRACDQAWRVIAALDARGGQPAVMRVTERPNCRVCLDFDTPVPAFFERLILMFGSRVERSKGSLLTFSVRDSALDEIATRWRGALWGDVVEPKGGNLNGRHARTHPAADG